MLNIKKWLNNKRLLKKSKSCSSEDFEKEVIRLQTLSRKVKPTKLGLNLVVISDTHGDLAFGNRFADFMKNVPEYDLLIILGDIYCYELDKILEIVPKDKIIALRGNHDSLDIYDKYKIRNINGEIFTFKGVRFAGIEGSFRYKNGDYPMYTHYESLELAKKIPKNADVLISHDCMFEKAGYDTAHTGLMGITYYVYNGNIKIHIHGHIHKSYEAVYKNGTIEKSVYLCEYLQI